MLTAWGGPTVASPGTDFRIEPWSLQNSATIFQITAEGICNPSLLNAFITLSEPLFPHLASEAGTPALKSALYVCVCAHSVVSDFLQPHDL